MINIYYTYPSGSIQSTATVIPDPILNNTSTIVGSQGSQNNSSTFYTDVVLETTASAYDASGPDLISTVGELRVYIKSGSSILASFPADNTNIFYLPASSATIQPPDTGSVILPPTFSNAVYTFIQSNSVSSTLNGSFSISYDGTSSLFTSESYSNGIISLYPTYSYNVVLSGSGTYYTSSVTIYNEGSKTYDVFTSSFSTPLSFTFSISDGDSRTIQASTTTLSAITLNWSSSNSIPVSPTNSLDAWNTYLNLTATNIINTGNSVTLLGDTLSSITTFEYTSSYLTNFTSSGLANLISCSIYNGGYLQNIPDLSVFPLIQYFNCSNNSISSSISNNILTGSLYLQYFDCSENSIVGNIPDFTGSFSLQYFDCNDNKLTGSVPFLSNIYSLQYFDCSYNKLSGSVVSLDDCYNLEYFRCHNNHLTGNIPNLLTTYNLKYFNCAYNVLSGSIPNLDTCYNLQEFYCNVNNLTGNIPNLSNVSTLQYFHCHNNKLSGSIPDISSLSNLLEFNCSNNYLTGSIPSLNDCVSLHTFDCSNNQLTGSIPSLNNCVNLYSFSCANNQLSGSIPYLVNCTNLSYIDCSTNALSNYSGSSTTTSSFDGPGLPFTLTAFYAQGLQLKVTDVDNILYDLDKTGEYGGVVDLSGGSTASPSSTGLSYTASLVSKGWVVNVN